MRKIFLICMLLITAPAAFAYIGPGAGISLVGSILGILAAIFLGLFAVLAWPIRRFLKRRKAAREGASNDATFQAGSESDESASTDVKD